ncbi:MAG: spinster family MFS transporter [Caulobacterales bacterium]
MSEQTVGVIPRASAYSYFVVCVLSVVYTLNFLDRQLVTILEEPIKKSLTLSDTQMGVLTGLSFAIFYTGFGIPIAWLADRTHRVRIMAAACAIWSLFSAACGLAANFPVLLAARIGVGVGEAGGSPPSYALIADYFPPQKRGVGLAIYSLGVPFGTGLGAFAGGKIAEAYGWRTAFLAVGLPGLIMAALVLILIREPKRGRFDALAHGEDSHAASLPLTKALALFLTNRTLMLTALSSGLSAFIGYAVLNWGPGFLIRNKHMGLGEIAQYYAPMSAIAGAVGTFGSGWLVDRLAQWKRSAYALLPALSFAISLPFFLWFVLTPTWQVGLVCLAVPLLMNNMYLSPAITVVQNAVAPGQRAMSGALLLFILNFIGLGGGPVYVGMISDAAKAAHHVNALQIGLLALAPFFILTIGAHLLAAWSLSRDKVLAKAIIVPATAVP